MRSVVDDVLAAISDLVMRGQQPTFSAILRTVRRWRADHTLHFRRVDGALQRLRRAGRIAFDRKAGWRIVQAEHRAREAQKEAAE